jgi:hypothetical protein
VNRRPVDAPTPAPGGTLTNNTNICGCLESMNVWYKPQPAANA